MNRDKLRKEIEKNLFVLKGAKDKVDCLELLALRYADAIIERLRNYSPVQGQGCELCTYKDGVFVKECGYCKWVKQYADEKLNEAADVLTKADAKYSGRLHWTRFTKDSLALLRAGILSLKSEPTNV